ncbi:MAG: BglG family transcription antiterminator [Erysipelotrichaceae bacterium]
MNQRQKNIIRELAAFENNTIANIATMMSVSYRTIQNDIEKINGIIKKYSVQIVKDSNKGIKLKSKSLSDLNNLLKQLENEISENNQLIYKLLERFITAPDYVKIDELDDEFFVSKKVLNNSVAEMKKILNRYNLKLTSKPAYGSTIEAKNGFIESKIRRMIIEIKQKEPSFYKITLNEITEKTIINAVKKRCCDSGFLTTEEGVNELCLAILVAINRIKQNKKIDYAANFVSYLIELEEFKLAESIVNDIKNFVPFTYNVSEIAYIARMMKAHRRLTNEDMKNLENSIRNDLDKLLNKIFNEIEKEYKIKIHDDLDLYIALGMHLVPLISRIQFDFYINNPLVEEVKRNYMHAFDMAITASNVIEKEFDIKLTEDEIGYIALHFNLALERKTDDTVPRNILVVCSSGGGLAKLLEYRIKQNFGSKINKIRTCNMYELKNIEIDKYDYILTTVKLDQTYCKPTLHISHMFTKEDINRIENIMSKESGLMTLLDVTNEQLFFSDIEAENSDDALKQICTRLNSVLPLQKDFIEQVKKREDLYSTEIGNNVVFPHPLVTSTPITFISITVLKKPIRWKYETVQVVIVGNTKIGESNKLQPMYKQFAQFVSDRKAIASLIQKPEYKTFKEIIERME